MGMMFERETIQYLFDKDTREKAAAINAGELDWKDAAPIEVMAAEAIQAASNGEYCAYWVVFKGTEKQALEARDTLEGLGMVVEDYYWHDADEYDTAGGRMSVYFSHMIANW